VGRVSRPARQEISAAQNALTAALCTLHRSAPALRDVVRACLGSLGRGGTGEMGQRIRDEILDVQRRNDCAGGFMEEWHQKLHNNSTPDDVVICEALLAYIESGLDHTAYWAHMNSHGVTTERLLSFGRAIRSQPRFEPRQCAGLAADLRDYLRTLKAVHSGADLASAADAVLGYSQPPVHSGVPIVVPPLAGVVSPRLSAQLQAAQERLDSLKRGRGQGGAATLLGALEAICDARRELRPWTRPGGPSLPDGRERDVIYLDLALEAAARQAVEASLGSAGCLAAASALEVAQAAALALESLAASAGSNAELLICRREWAALAAVPSDEAAREPWALRAKAASDRTRLWLAAAAARACAVLGPPAAALGAALGVPAEFSGPLFAEEVVRSGAAAPLSQLLTLLEPRLRALAALGVWQLLSSHPAAGQLVAVPSFAAVPPRGFSRPTVLLAQHVGGEEEPPPGCVAVLTLAAPDVLSHVAVRARNERILFATAHSEEAFAALAALAARGASVTCTPTADGGDLSVAEGVAPAPAPAAGAPAHAAPHAIEPRPFQGTYALSSAAFSRAVVGGKSRNLEGLRSAADRLPAGVRLPPSVALTFGAFDAALADPVNAALRPRLTALLAALPDAAPGGDEDAALAAIRAAVCELAPPSALLAQLHAAMAADGIGHGDSLGGAGWAAVRRVWASKWNGRATAAYRKAGLVHGDVAMAVLVQPLIPAAYAFVLHTTNPVSGDAGEVYGELVVGLGETLVGACPGRALAFAARKTPGGGCQPPRLLGFPSKPAGLFAPPGGSLIFRSDSNGEDLEGFAGAGLYDSIPLAPLLERPLDYTAEPLLADGAARDALLAKLAAAGVAAEAILGGPQDVEGCVDADGAVFLVQTRPQVF